MLEVAGIQHHLESFQGIEVPPGISHQMMNQSQYDVEFLVISHPRSQGDRMVEEG